MDVSNAEGSRSLGLGELGRREAPLAIPWNGNSFTLTRTFLPQLCIISPLQQKYPSLSNPIKALIITPSYIETSKFPPSCTQVPNWPRPQN